jgi:hypothetical protein
MKTSLPPLRRKTASGRICGNLSDCALVPRPYSLSLSVAAPVLKSANFMEPTVHMEKLDALLADAV